VLRRSALRAQLTALAGALFLAAGSAHAAPVAPLSHHGRWITDARGRVVILHGLNMVDKLPPYRPATLGFGADDARFLQGAGFDTVRVGIIFKGLEPQPGQFDGHYLASIARTLRTLERHRIFPLVDFHQDMYNERYQGEGFPDWATIDDGLPAQPRQGFPTNYYVMPALSRAYDSFWANRAGPGGVGLQDRYAAAWAHVAHALRHDRRLVGYDIFNEPFPGSQLGTCASPPGCPAFDQQVLTPFTKRTFRAIRAADRRRLLWYEPLVTFDFGADTSHGDTGDARAGFTFHDYCLASQPGAPSGGSASQGACDTAEGLTFSNADKESNRTGDALLLSEFGATDDLTEIGRVVRLADKHMVSWQEWSYWNEDVCCPRPIEGLVRDIHRAPRGSNVKRAKLLVLARPYPEAVAGSPVSYGFDTTRRRFKLTYSTRRIDGRRFRRRTITEVRIPRVQYPHGYRATVAGARVHSGRGAPILRLLARPRASRVTLTVVPR
jgi:endoglycosylceramidase